ncbi:Hypothetical protein SMAX5B_019901 [Scophthalmus maximus]|uniref:Uncharacterized protein n=1 Tax=Scophthalmus maximus TaxID=52904 RepID=A0A2U9B3Y2_SCOMX|nr:Hypothetical protein SMAX5B_019901 [Scophthalmus maximus]
MPFDCGSEEPHLGHVNGGYLFLRAGSLRVTRSSVVMLSTVDGALGEPQTGTHHQASCNCQTQGLPPAHFTISNIWLLFGTQLQHELLQLNVKPEMSGAGLGRPPE